MPDITPYIIITAPRSPAGLPVLSSIMPMGWKSEKYEMKTTVVISVKTAQ